MEQDELKISIRYQSQYGYIGYNPRAHSINVELANQDKRGEIEDYLSKEQIIPVSADSVGAFTHNKLLASTGIAEFKAVLTCLWNATDVSVDWSRPVE